jgi:tetratricopeptide (TPR) repeat protein
MLKFMNCRDIRKLGLLALTAAVSLTSVLPAQPASAASKPTYSGKMEMGQLLFFNGDVDRAIRAFEAAAELNPHALEPHTMLLNIYVQKGGEEALQKAIPECYEVLKRKPNNKDVHFVLGNLLRNVSAAETDPEKQKAKLDEAIKEVQIAESQGARKSLCEYTVGMTVLQQGDTEGAMRHLEAALADQPDLADAHMVHAVLAFKQATKPDADNKPKDIKSPQLVASINKVLEELDLSIKQKGKNAEGHNTKGEILLAMGKYSEAMDEYQKALKDEPKFTQAWVGTGTCEAQAAMAEKEGESQRKHIEKARDAFNEAKKLNPNDKNVVYALAVMLERMGRLDEAASEFENCVMLETDPVTKGNIQMHLQQLRGVTGNQLGGGMFGSSVGGVGGVGNTMFTDGALAIPMKDLIKAPEKNDGKKSDK